MLQGQGEGSADAPIPQVQFPEVGVDLDQGGNAQGKGVLGLPYLIFELLLGDLVSENIVVCWGNSALGVTSPHQLEGVFDVVIEPLVGL